MRASKVFSVILFLLGVVFFITADPRNATAVVRTWTNGTCNNQWNNVYNWEPDGVPDSDDTVYVSSGTVYSPYMIASSDNGSITINGGGVSVTVTGPVMNVGIKVGLDGMGTLNIKQGGSLEVNGYSYIGQTSGIATVDGPGSTWVANDSLVVGWVGQGELTVSGGGIVTSNADEHGIAGVIADSNVSSGTVSVTGNGSSWTNSGSLMVGLGGAGTLTITECGLVSVGQNLTIDSDADGDSAVNMTTGGMLALYGEADDSLDAFLNLVSGSDAIRYWNDSASNWSDLAGATYGKDYLLCYHAEGDLAGYTVLTVPTPAAYGDANRDGTVGSADLDIVRAHWGESVPTGDFSFGDMNADGYVGSGDLDVVRANWGSTAAAVPEPGFGLLILLGLAAFVRRRFANW